MLDYEMYKTHHDNGPEKHSKLSILMDTELDCPPEAPFLALLPAEVQAFSLDGETWGEYLHVCVLELPGLTMNKETIQVDYIRPVEWEEDPFRHVVLKAETKESLLKLVGGASAGEERKRSLGVLLSGDRGTGKDSTCRAVAEAVQRPLFRLLVAYQLIECLEYQLDLSLNMATKWNAGRWPNRHGEGASNLS